MLLYFSCFDVFESFQLTSHSLQVSASVASLGILTTAHLMVSPITTRAPTPTSWLRTTTSTPLCRPWWWGGRTSDVGATGGCHSWIRCTSMLTASTFASCRRRPSWSVVCLMNAPFIFLLCLVEELKCCISYRWTGSVWCLPSVQLRVWPSQGTPGRSSLPLSLDLQFALMAAAAEVKETTYHSLTEPFFGLFVKSFILFYLCLWIRGHTAQHLQELCQRLMWKLWWQH